MVTNGLIIIVICITIRLIKCQVHRYSTAWAVLSIAYTIGVHIGTIMILWGLVVYGF